MAGMKWLLVVFVAISLRGSVVRADGDDDDGGKVEAPVVDRFSEDLEDADDGGEGDVDDGEDGEDGGVGRSLFSNADPCFPNPCPIGTRCRSSFGTGYTCDRTYTDPCSPNPCPSGQRCTRNSLTGGYLCEIIHVDPCAANPCPFGTVCKANAFGGGYTCDKIYVDPCSPNPCPFGQRCERAGDRPHCVAPPPPVDPCHPNPCPVGQRCTRNGAAGHFCLPVPTPANPCHPNPCPFGQQCTRTGQTGYHCVVLPTQSPCAGNPCLNGGRCRVVPGSRYTCDCLPGYTGSHCEFPQQQGPTACHPNPCVNGCQCVESCRHASGYFCKNDNGYLGKNCTIPPPVVRCAPGMITVTVDDAFVREYDMMVRNGKLYTALTADSAPGQDCYATFNGIAHSFSIPSPYTKCGTKINRDSNSMTVENNIWLNRFTNGQYDMPVPVICYQCRYMTEYTFMTSLSPAVDQPPILRSEGRMLKPGTINLCKVGHTCPNDCPTQFAVTGGAVYTVGELLHVIIRGDSTDILAVKSLYLSCDGHPGSSSPVVNLVSNGCPAAAGHRMPASVTHSGASPVACVSFQVPRLHGCSRFYIHARMDVCNAGVPCRTPVCHPLVGRKRREVVNRSEHDVEVGDVFGPIYIWEGGEGVPSVILFPDLSIVNTTAKISDNLNQERARPLRREEDDRPEHAGRRNDLSLGSVDAGPRPYVYALVAVAVFSVVVLVGVALLALHRRGDAPRGSKLSLFLK